MKSLTSRPESRERELLFSLPEIIFAHSGEDGRVAVYDKSREKKKGKLHTNLPAHELAVFDAVDLRVSPGVLDGRQAKVRPVNLKKRKKDNNTNTPKTRTEKKQRGR